MNTITLSNEKIYDGNLILVNQDYPLRLNLKNDIIPFDEQHSNILMKREALNVLQLIFQKISCEDKIVPVSGYRTAKEQTEIYETSLKESGEDFTRKFVALPNHSEHQTGLAIDLALKKDNIDFICPEFPYEGICDEFRKTAYNYGFIERYPKGKEQVTGIAHEPWHFRYVGYPHSEIMKEKQLTLEEYNDFVKQFQINGKHLKTFKKGKNIETFFVIADVGGTTTIALPDNSVYQVSGNNIDGFIVTLWRNSNE